MALSGTEMMLKSLGLGEAMAGVKKLLEAGAIEKVLEFSNQVETLNAKITLVAEQQVELQRQLTELVRLLTSGPDAADGRPGYGGAASGAAN